MNHSIVALSVTPEKARTAEAYTGRGELHDRVGPSAEDVQLAAQPLQAGEPLLGAALVVLGGWERLPEQYIPNGQLFCD